MALGVWMAAVWMQSQTIMPAAGADVELLVLREVTGDKSKPGDPVKLQVNKTLSVDGGIVPVGTPAWGVVDAVRPSAALKAGQIDVRLTRLVIGGVDIPIDGTVSETGRGGSNDQALKVMFAPMYALFAKSNAGKLKAGDIVHAHLPATFRLPAAASPP